jgi:hypothetical protein
MPIRTKDFLLLILTIAFLVVGITSTIKSDLATTNQQATVSLFLDVATNETEVIYEAEVVNTKSEDTRASRLAVLREKIRGFVLAEPAPAVFTEPTVAAEVIAIPKSAGEIDKCPVSTKFLRLWSATNLKFEIVEGARIVYRDSEVNPNFDTYSTGTIPSMSAREVVLQLPLRTTPLAIKSCLGSDVVGIALDGSLIRNDEHNLYKIFGQETLIGYALDGFAIYGQANNLNTDACGGAMVNGEYGYYLSAQREGVLGCFGGIPVAI